MVQHSESLSPLWKHRSDGAISLIPVEDPRIDPNPMVHLFSRMDEATAEREICDTLDAINTELIAIRRSTGFDDVAQLLPLVTRVCERAGRIGLAGLSRVAADVALCLGTGDHAAFHATMARLLRVADRSLTEIWNGARSG